MTKWDSPKDTNVKQWNLRTKTMTISVVADKTFDKIQHSFRQKKPSANQEQKGTSSN